MNEGRLQGASLPLLNWANRDRARLQREPRLSPCTYHLTIDEDTPQSSGPFVAHEWMQWTTDWKPFRS